ncbi:MAG: alpha/beta hydrolase [Actinomycetota bacterium]|nr:alpha/beta hydrolase [Actinomycetota bacterium]
MDPEDVLTRPGPGPDAVVRYGDHPEHLLDVHLPVRRVDAGDAPAHVVVLLHGGFWRQRYDRTHTRPMAQGLAAAGYVVVTPEYRRSGGAGGWPRTFDDVATALQALPRVTEVVPGGTLAGRPPVLVGHSAGGHLALWAALRPGAPRVRRVVALAPVADLYQAHARRLGADAVTALMGGDPAELPDAYAAADAARLLRRPIPAAVSVIVLHGDRDRQVPLEMSRALAAASPGVDLIELAGAEHFGLIDPLSTVWPHVLAAIRR